MKTLSNDFMSHPAIDFSSTQNNFKISKRNAKNKISINCSTMNNSSNTSNPQRRTFYLATEVTPRSKIFKLLNNNQNEKKRNKNNIENYTSNKLTLSSIAENDLGDKKESKILDVTKNLLAIKGPKKKSGEFSTINFINNYSIRNNVLSNKNYKSALDNNEEATVRKLGIWESENLEFKNENYDSIYKRLYNLYSLEQNKQKLNDLIYFKKLLSTTEGINQNYEKIAHGKNKILDSLIDKQKKEQNALILNSISKGTSQYGQANSSLLQRENNLGIKLETISEKAETNSPIPGESTSPGKTEYRRLISDKNRQETNMRKDLMDLASRIFQKKEEKNQILREINKAYDDLKNYDDIYFRKKSILDKEMDILKDNFQHKQKFIRENCKFCNEGVINDHLFNNVYSQTSRISTLEHNLLLLVQERKKKHTQLNETRKALLNRLNINNDEISYLRYVYHLLLKEMQEYYYQILKNGYDVRYDGLVWVVKHLLEINSVIEYHHFPKYLSHEEINYLIFMAKLTLEENLMSLILTSLQNKQKKKRLEQNNENFEQMNILIKTEDQKREDEIKMELEKERRYNKQKYNTVRERTNSISTNNLPSFKNNNKRLSTGNTNYTEQKESKKYESPVKMEHKNYTGELKISKFYITDRNTQFSDIHSRLYFMFNNIRDNYKEAFKYCEDKRIDDENLNKIIAKLHEELIQTKKCIVGEESENILSKFLNSNIDSKNDLEMILVLREKIKENKQFREKLKKDMANKLKEDKEMIKNNKNNEQANLRNDLVYSALFGSSLSLK